VWSFFSTSRAFIAHLNTFERSLNMEMAILSTSVAVNQQDFFLVVSVISSYGCACLVGHEGERLA
jgi:hypothetical protein